MKTLFFTGRNPENQNGLSWKVWKIQRTGRVVETRWGPIKIIGRRIVLSRSLASKRWPSFATVTEAKSFYDRKVREKLRKGYEIKPRRRRK
ncbi:MAG: hypothetical protein HZA93_19730 [Verrucomicrobia bacterium]|nr:hypothetical protein [Verrucomicrobiota bacterium]